MILKMVIQNHQKVYNYDTGKVVGKPKTVGDGLKKEVELDEGMKYTHAALTKKD